MKLRRLRIGRLPGIEQPFELDDLDADVVLIVGPNGSGKSSLCRAVRATLWPGARGAAAAAADLSVESVWRDGDQTLHADASGVGVRWQRGGLDADGPSLPDAHLAGCYTLGLRELLGTDGAAGDLAGEIRRQLAGGYDLAAVRSRYTAFAKSSHGRKPARALDEAERARVAEEREQQQLGRDQERLASLRRSRAEAAEARRELDDWRRAAERLERLAERDRLTGELAAHPPELARLRGEEFETLTEIEGALEQVRETCALLRSRIEDALVEQRACGLGHGPIDGPAISEARERVRLWHQAAERLESARARTLESESRARVARAQLAGEEIDLERARTELDGDVLDQVDSWSRERVDLANERSVLEARRRPLEAEGASVDEAERLDRAAELLRVWLAEPDPPGRTAVSGLALVAVAAAASAVALFVAEAAPPGLWALPASLSGVTVAWLGLRLSAGTSGRRRSASEFEALGVAAPETWERASVVSRAIVLEREGAAQRRRLKDAEQAVDIDRELQALAVREAKADAFRSRLVAGLGLDPGRDGLRLLDVASRVQRWRDADQALATARETERALEGEERRLGDSAVEPFVSWQPEMDPPRNAAEAAARLDDLARRGAEWTAAETRRQELDRGLQREIESRKRLDRRRSDLLESVGLASADPTLARRRLEALVARWPAYEELRERRDGAEREAARIGEMLSARADWLELDAASVEGRLQEAKEQADREADLASEIAVIEERLAKAVSESSLEYALAEEQAARDALRSALEERLDAEAALGLLEDVETEHERHHSPSVLRRARSWFAEFTHHKYDLAVDTREDEAEFRAIDTNRDVGLSLDELSDGTRAQLWLAARLAFAIRSERGPALPLFLDEALTSSDPERFRAVVEGLLLLARDGHQVFYLTCDPVDVDHWRELCRELGSPPPVVVDLAQVRFGTASARGPAALAPPQRRTVPAPGADGPEAYGARLGVAAPRPFEPVDSWHLFHLLRDDCALLHRLLEGARLATVGQWRTARRHDALGAVLGEDESRRIDARVELADGFVEAWSIGRGRPLVRSALEESPNVTPRFVDDLDALARRLGRDAEATLDALDAGAITGFRSKSKAELRRELEESGVLDPSDVLGPDGVRTRLLARMAPLVEQSWIDLEEIHRRVDEWWAYLSGSGESGQGGDCGDAALGRTQS